MCSGYVIQKYIEHPRSKVITMNVQSVSSSELFCLRKIPTHCGLMVCYTLYRLKVFWGIVTLQPYKPVLSSTSCGWLVYNVVCIKSALLYDLI